MFEHLGWGENYIILKENIMQNCNFTATKGIKLQALVILKKHCTISHLLFSPMKLSIRFSLGAWEGKKGWDYFNLLKVVFVAEVIHRIVPVVFYFSTLYLCAALILSSLSFLLFFSLHPFTPFLPAFLHTLFTFSFGYFSYFSGHTAIS